MRLIACAILMSVLASVEGFNDSVANDPALRVDNLKCGPNALLAFLILSGRTQTTLGELGNIPITSEGASLLSLRDAANRLGVKTEVRHYSIDALDSLPLPAIVLFKPQHFVVFYKVDHEHFYLIDGTTALPDVGPKSKLLPFWTGYALIEKRMLWGLPWHLRWVVVTALALFGVECAVLGYILWRRRLRNPKGLQREPTTPRPTCAGLGFICLAVFLLFPAARAGTPVAHPWRQAANGGVNVLYAYLAANGREADYSALVKEQAGNAAAEQYTVSTLAQMASSHGARLRAVWLTMDELRSCPKPVIVHMDGTSPDEGAFLLIIRLTDHHVLYMNGPSGTLDMLSAKDFRRVWSGAALLPKPEAANGVMISIVAFLAGLALPPLPRAWRLTRSQKRQPSVIPQHKCN